MTQMIFNIDFIREDRVYGSRCVGYHKLNQIKHWKPKIGEYCWFYGKNNTPIFAKVLDILPTSKGKYKTDFLGCTYFDEDNAEIFIGSLPERIENGNQE